GVLRLLHFSNEGSGVSLEIGKRVDVGDIDHGMPPIREFHVGFHVSREATPGASPFCARVSADRGGLFTPACPAPPPLSAPASPPASTPPAAPRRAGYGQSRPRSHPPPRSEEHTSELQSPDH